MRISKSSKKKESNDSKARGTHTTRALSTLLDMVDAKVCLMPRLSFTELVACAGLVRSVCEVASDVMVVAPKAHVVSIRRLFEDVRNVRFVFVDDWTSLSLAPRVPDDGAATPAPAANILTTIETQGYAAVPVASYREVCPYTAMGVASSMAVTKLKVQRFGDVERRLLDIVKEAVGPTFVVVHDNPTRRIRTHLIPQGMPVVRVDDPRFASTGKTPFDWIQVLDHAMQLHAIDSTYLMLADLMALRPRKYCHAYANDDAGMSFRAGAYRDVIVVWG